MKNLFKNHYGYICGLVSGAGLALFSIEAFRPTKNPFFYIGSFGLIVIGRLVYSALRKRNVDSLNSTSGNVAR